MGTTKLWKPIKEQKSRKFGMGGTDYRYHRIWERKGNGLDFLVSQVVSWIWLNLPQGSKLDTTSLSERLEAKQCSMGFHGAVVLLHKDPACFLRPYSLQIKLFHPHANAQIPRLFSPWWLPSPQSGWVLSSLLLLSRLLAVYLCFHHFHQVGRCFLAGHVWFPSHSPGLAESGPSLRICLLNRWKLFNRFHSLWRFS